MNNLTFSRFITIVRSPFFFIGWISLIITSFLFFDKPLAYYFYQFHYTKFFLIVDVITNLGLAWIYFILFLILYIGSRFIFKNNRYSSMMLFIFFSLIVSGLFCDVIKILLSRSRPDLLFHQGLYGFQFLHLESKMWSFPSGHATVITSVMLALSFFYNRFWWLFVIAFIVISITRVIVTAHFLSDILAGMYLGTITVIWLNELIKDRNNISLRELIWQKS